MRYILAVALISTLIGSAGALAQESPQQKCVVDTTTDQSTGQTRTSGTGVQVCSEGNSGSIGISTTGKELKHFMKYPIGTSNASVAKHIGNAVHSAAKNIGSTVHNVFHHW